MMTERIKGDPYAKKYKVRLSPKQVADIASQYKERKNIHHVSKLLIEAYHFFLLKWARYYANKFQGDAAMSIEDFMQEGRIALILALEKFNPEKGAFTTIAYYYVRRKMKRFLQQNGRKEHYKRSKVYQKTIIPMKFDEIDFINFPASYEADSFEQIETKVDQENLLRVGFSILTKSERYLVEKYFFENKSLKELAYIYGVTKEAIRQRKIVILNKLRERIQEVYPDEQGIEGRIATEKKKKRTN